MNSVRRRKIREVNGRPSPKGKKRDVGSSSIHRSLLCLILCASILTVFVVLYLDKIPWHVANRAVDKVAKTLGYHKPVYAVVLDAGSTGSRVLAFTFHESYLDGNLILDKELFEHVKPGLSAFADNPSKAVASLRGLLEKAKNEIPAEYWNKTPLILKATAGLRLLPIHKAENLLNSVREFFKSTPFLTNNNSVEIMDGTDEGIFSWFTVNFLLDRISEDPSKTVAALDLGGGSTQVTFSALTPASLSQNEYIHKAITPKGLLPVYTNSYLGLGLMAARKAVITLNHKKDSHLTSECINPIIKDKKFRFGEEELYVSGLQTNYPTIRIPKDQFSEEDVIPIVDFDKCSEIIIDYVRSKAMPPEELPSKRIFAFSYYFDRASDVGMIDPFTGGKVKISDFQKNAKKVCKVANADQPFICLDLTFIWALFEHGLGLDPNTEVYLYKKINGHEISWALGAAYDLLRRI